MFTFTVNGMKKQVDESPETPLLWVLRENLGITNFNHNNIVANGLHLSRNLLDTMRPNEKLSGGMVLAVPTSGGLGSENH